MLAYIHDYLHLAEFSPDLDNIYYTKKDHTYVQYDYFLSTLYHISKARIRIVSTVAASLCVTLMQELNDKIRERSINRNVSIPRVYSENFLQENYLIKKEKER